MSALQGVSCPQNMTADGPGSPVDVTLYPGATHDFDEPSSRRQSAPGTEAAMDDAIVKAAGILDGWKK
ncbi:hypothetical protein FXB40_40185 [Bradyrhizobium rifense]|uniref:Dienelactone hydrolase domain-containing protein n=1 Tax=Bradyrhizobium rifense TaxID=515499 RepID=A0A5D3JZM6_9BRAD|nr:hypothetical protein [Bradyrhizobium rifense]TYL87511.1 hypothetical protein FXB40_40185 [Bradyrhizobium rifense]